MVAPVDRPSGVLAGTFGVGILTFLLLPSEVGYQDLAALISREVASVERSQKSSLASPFGTIHAANLSLPQPIGSGIKPALGYTLASLDPGNAELTGSIRERILRDSALMPSTDSSGPRVDRSRKGDQLTVETRKQDSVAVKGDRLRAPRVQQAESEIGVEASPQQVAIAPSIQGTAEVAPPSILEAEHVIAAETQLATAAEQAAKTQMAALPAPREVDESVEDTQTARSDFKAADSKPAEPEAKRKPTQQADKSRATQQASSKSSEQSARARRDAERKAERIARDKRDRAEKLARTKDTPKPDETAPAQPADVAVLYQGQAPRD